MTNEMRYYGRAIHDASDAITGDFVKNEKQTKKLPSSDHSMLIAG